MEWNKENKKPHGDKTSRRSSKPPGNGADGTEGLPLADGGKEKRGFMRRILRGAGGGERPLGLRNTPENVGGGGEGEPLRSPAAAAADQNPPLAASSASQTAQQSSSASVRAGGARKKNFVKANMLAAASARNLRSATHLESHQQRQPRSLALTPTPGGAGATAGLVSTSSRLGGSARSLNSEPGREEAGKVARNPELRKSFHFGKASRRPRETLEVPRRTVITRKSISEAPELLVTPPVPQSPAVRRARGLQQGLSLSSPAGREMVESLTARLEQLQGEVEELRNDLRISENENQRKVADLAGLVENNSRKHQEDLKNVLEMNKCQLESQRLEFKEEIRKLLSFKDSVPVRPKESNADQNIAQPDTFRNTSDRLLNKIHRLSARMSLQDSDMKELIQVKSWNEKKLDSAKRNPMGRLLNVPDLQSCNSQSEPDLAGM